MIFYVGVLVLGSLISNLPAWAYARRHDGASALLLWLGTPALVVCQIARSKRKLLVLTAIVGDADDQPCCSGVPAYVCALNADGIGAASSGTKPTGLQCQREGASDIDARVHAFCRPFTICDAGDAADGRRVHIVDCGTVSATGTIRPSGGPRTSGVARASVIVGAAVSVTGVRR